MLSHQLLRVHYLVDHQVVPIQQLMVDNSKSIQWGCSMTHQARCKTFSAQLMFRHLKQNWILQLKTEHKHMTKWLWRVLNQIIKDNSLKWWIPQSRKINQDKFLAIIIIQLKASVKHKKILMISRRKNTIQTRQKTMLDQILNCKYKINNLNNI